MTRPKETGGLSGSGAWRALRSEIYRARRHRTAWLLATLPGLAAAGRVVLARISSAAETSEQIGRQIVSGELNQASQANLNAYGPLADGLRAGLAVGVLMLLAATAALVAGERDSGTIRLALTRSVSRAGLAASKLATAVLLAIPVLVSVLLGALLSSAGLFEFGPYVEDGYQFMSAAELNAEITQGIALALPALLATACFGLMISSLSRSSGQAIAVSLALYMVFDLFKGLAGGAGTLIFASYNPSVADHSYLREVSLLARGFSDAGYDPDSVLLARWAPLPQAALFIGVSFAAMQRRKM